VQKQLAKGQAAGLGAEIVSLFDGELNPVAPKAQKKVQVPEGYVDSELKIIDEIITFIWDLKLCLNIKKY
jgi:hypothetical protein